MTTRTAWTLLLTGSIFAACSYTLPSTDASLLCGNDVVDDAEECDDGNDLDSDGCDSNCTTSTCGNGIVGGTEECDDGNTINEDACTNACNKPVCGDGIVSPGEECDDRNAIDNDGCDADCHPSPCGNGVTESGEECDDGNSHWYDTCSPQCKNLPGTSICGNNTIEGNESCDDGGTENGDQCNATCVLKGESSLFIGQTGVSGNQDGVGEGATIQRGQYMALWGDKIYIASNEVVRVIDIPSRSVTTIAGSSGASAYVDATKGIDARFGEIRGITTDGKTLWIADVGNHLLRTVSVDAPHEVLTVAGKQEVTGNNVHIPIADGIGDVARLDAGRGLTYLKGLVYFVEDTANVLRTFNPATNEVKTIAGIKDTAGGADGMAAVATFNGPRHTATNGTNLIYIADTEGSKIRSFDIDTNEVATIAGTGTCGYVDADVGANILHRPRGMAFDGESIYFAEVDAHTLRQVLPTGMVTTLSGEISACALDCSCGWNAPAGSHTEGYPDVARWDFPYDIVWHARSRSLFVSDAGSDLIRRIQ